MPDASGSRRAVLHSSILFLPEFEQLRPVLNRVFVSGSGLMLIGALGQLLVELLED